MLKIRSEQLEVFKGVAEDAFIGDVVEYLREHYGDRTVQLSEGSAALETLPEHTLRQMVQRGIVRASRYGINSRGNLKAFIVIMVVTAPNFDDHPLIKRILNDKQVGAESRIDELWKRTMDQNWIAVRQSYNASVWDIQAIALTPEQETLLDSEFGVTEPPLRIREFEMESGKTIKNTTLQQVSEQEFLELDMAKGYLWVVTKHGELLIGEALGTGVLENDGYVQRLGVVTLTEGEPARIAGELFYQQNRWILNNKSACYSVYPDRGPAQLENVAERFRNAGQEIAVEYISLRNV